MRQRLRHDLLDVERVDAVDALEPHVLLSAASSTFSRRIFGSSRSCTRIPMRVALSAYAGRSRRVVPICSLPRRRSRAPSRATCHGMIRCAFPDTKTSPSGRCPRPSRSSSSWISTAGSTTQPGPDGARHAGHDPGRDRADLVRLALDHDRVPGVRAALVAADEVRTPGRAGRRSSPSPRRPTAPRRSRSRARASLSHAPGAQVPARRDRGIDPNLVACSSDGRSSPAT